jgi:hypothetical protein
MYSSYKNKLNCSNKQAAVKKDVIALGLYITHISAFNKPSLGCA